jgi:hypothetical protein
MILDYVDIGPLAPGAQTTYAFASQGGPPDIVYPTQSSPIGVQGTPTATSVVFVNHGVATESARFWLLWAPQMGKAPSFTPLCWQGYTP